MGRRHLGLAVTICLRCPCHLGASDPIAHPAHLLLPQPSEEPAWSWRCPSAPSKDTGQTSVSCHLYVILHSHHSSAPLAWVGGASSLTSDLCRASPSQSPSSWGIPHGLQGGPAPRTHHGRVHRSHWPVFRLTLISGLLRVNQACWSPLEPRRPLCPDYVVCPGLSFDLGFLLHSMGIVNFLK